MIPDHVFEERLRTYDPGLFVRWEYWRDEGDGQASCAPYAGPIFRQAPEGFETEGRFVVYHRDRANRAYKVFDVAYPDGSYHPLDSRVIWALRTRDSAWDRIDEEIAATQERKRKECRASKDGEVAGAVSDGLEIAYRTGTGLRQFALGTPEAPAVANRGTYTVTDRRRNLGA